MPSKCANEVNASKLSLAQSISYIHPLIWYILEFLTHPHKPFFLPDQYPHQRLDYTALDLIVGTSSPDHHT